MNEAKSKIENKDKMQEEKKDSKKESKKENHTHLKYGLNHVTTLIE